MKEVFGDIWDYHEQGYWITITTNGTIKNNGECVMGKGIALQAKKKFPYLPYELGKWISQSGNQLHIFLEYRIITFPTKHDWWEKSDTALIELSCQHLVACADFHKLDSVYMVRPGCKHGGLDWKDVKPILEKHLDDRFVVVEISE